MTHRSHREGAKRASWQSRVNEYARQLAAEVERQWQGRWVVIWSPGRSCFTAFSATIGAEYVILDDPSVEGLGHRMQNVNMEALMKSPKVLTNAP